jgi:hypothetical protein
MCSCERNYIISYNFTECDKGINSKLPSLDFWNLVFEI